MDMLSKSLDAVENWICPVHPRPLHSFHCLCLLWTIELLVCEVIEWSVHQVGRPQRWRVRTALPLIRSTLTLICTSTSPLPVLLSLLLHSASSTSLINQAKAICSSQTRTLLIRKTPAEMRKSCPRFPLFTRRDCSRCPQEPPATRQSLRIVRTTNCRLRTS